MKQHGPWKIKSSEVKYKNPWIEVREDQVVRPDGKDGIYGTIAIKSGVSVLPIDAEGNVYLTREFHYGVGRETTEVVSGGIDEGESPIDCAKRELKEELGIIGQEWVGLGHMDPFTSYVNSPVHFFLARRISFSDTEREGTEEIHIVKTSFDNAVEMVMEGKITHGNSCLLILKAAKYLGRL